MHWFWRAMIVALDEWVVGARPPPASRYPRIADGTLVTREALRFPGDPGRQRALRRAPRLAHRFRPAVGRGMITRQPPMARQPFVTLVPQVDADGNETAGVRLPELGAPLATYTGWNLRAPSIGAPAARVSFLGSCFPFPRAKPEGDPRRSIAERYPDRDRYLGAFTRQALDLVRDRYILPEDLPAVLERGLAEWEAATK